MKQQKIIAVLAIIIVVLCIGFLVVRHKVEGFAEQKRLDLKNDCTIYFTKDIGTCDTPTVKNGVLINFNFHRYYYEMMRKTLEDRRRSKGTLTMKESKMYRTILDVLKQYDNMIDGKSCKLTVPNWKQITDSTNNVTLGNLPQNRHRGAANEWAFCVTKHVPGINQGGRGLQIAKKRNGKPYLLSHDGEKYERGAFPDFSVNTIRKLFCAETSSLQTQKFSFGLQLNVIDRKVNVISNGEIRNVVDNRLIDALYNRGIIFDMLRNWKETQTLHINCKSVRLPIYRIDRDICGRDFITLTSHTLRFKFNKGQGLLKRAPLSQFHLLGTRSVLLVTRKMLIDQRKAVQNLRNNSKIILDMRKKFYEGVLWNIKAVEQRIRYLDSKINGMSRSQRGVKTASGAALAIPGVGAAAALVGAFTSIGLAAQKRKWMNERNQKRAQLYILLNGLDCNKYPNIGWCDKETYSCISPATCPHNKPMMTEYVKEETDVFRPLDAKLNWYNTKIREVNDALATIDRSLRKYVKELIAGSIEVESNIPFESLSWDTKFYVPL